jgi:hypothetical protein
MKKLLVILFFLPFMLQAQDAPKQNLYISVNMDVKDGMEDAFKAAVKSHNAAYHAEDSPYRARLFYNINGPSGGMYTWVMGPTSYTALDSRPGEGAHDDDWKNVSDLVEKFGTPSYWTYSEKLSQAVEGKNSKRVIWMYDIKSGQGKRWSELVGKVKEVYEAKRPTESFYVVWNEFANTNAGMDAAIIFPFDKWAWMDRNSNFSEEYEEVHGPGSWHHFLNEFTETTNGRVDWLRTLID